MSQPSQEEIAACVKAMVQSEPWSSFWSADDARKLVEAVLKESRHEARLEAIRWRQAYEEARNLAALAISNGGRK